MERGEALSGPLSAYALPVRLSDLVLDPTTGVMSSWDVRAVKVVDCAPARGSNSLEQHPLEQRVLTLQHGQCAILEAALHGAQSRALQ